jgi:hypothetical protein
MNKPQCLSAIAGFVFMLANGGCTRCNSNSVGPSGAELVEIYGFGAGAILSDIQVKYHAERATRGDGESAYKLYAHYGIGIGDEAKARAYFDLAVSLNYPAALYSKAVQLWDSKTPDLEQVRILMKRAIDGGYKDSSGALMKVEAEIKKKTAEAIQVSPVPSSTPNTNSTGAGP